MAGWDWQGHTLSTALRALKSESASSEVKSSGSGDWDSDEAEDMTTSPGIHVFNGVEVNR